MSTKQKEFFIRGSLIDDSDEIAKVAVQSWRESYEGIFPKETLDGLDWKANSEGRKKFIYNSDDKKSIVAILDNKIIGFCDFGRIKADDQVLQLGEIYAIYVLRKYQGQSIGTDLFNEAVKSLKQQGYANFIIWALKENIKAQCFYKKNDGTESSSKRNITINNRQYEEIQFEFLCDKNLLVRRAEKSDSRKI